MTTAILERPEIDTRECHVTGPEFAGIAQSVNSQSAKAPHHSTKILMVHGISRHLPGYSYPLRAKLAKALGLGATRGDYKEIRLKHPDFKNDDGSFSELGTLRVYNHFAPDTGQSFLLYELTWSPITEPRKELIAFDNSYEFNHERAKVNAALKTFMNSTVPDLLIYLGSRKAQINMAVAQSVCWMFSGDWEAIKDGAYEYCDPEKYNVPSVIEDDAFFFVTHSLGSRITIDMIHFFSLEFAKNPRQSERVAALNKAIQNKNFTVFMLANQLPLLELAHDPPEIVNSQGDYCTPGGSQWHNRVMNRMDIVAFSDPNDILSYPVPPRYAADHIDSRVCAQVTNVSLNVADERNVLGLAEFADPLRAHQGYHEDDRVIGLITGGISADYPRAEIIQQRCDWLEMRAEP